jgi:hypothetical protein
MKPGTKDWNLWTMSQKFIFPKLFGQYFVTVIEGWLTNKDLVSFLEEKKSYPIQIGYSILFPLDSYFNFWVNGAFVFFVMTSRIYSVHGNPRWELCVCWVIQWERSGVLSALWFTLRVTSLLHLSLSVGIREG